MPRAWGRILTVCIILFFPALVQGGIGFRFEQRISLPKLKEAATVTFAQPDSSSAPILLATDGNQVIVYSVERDSLLFSRTVARQYERCRQIFLADINRDSIPDLICGLTTKNRFRVIMLDGRSGYRDSSVISFPASAANCDAPNRTLAIVELGKDHRSELFISADTGKIDGRALGFSRLYRSFPQSIGWSIDRSIKNPSVISLADKSRFIWGEASPCSQIPYSASHKLNSTASVISIDPDGKIGKFGLVYPNPCGALPPQFHSIDPVLRLSRFDPSRITQTEMITEADRQFHCGDDTTAQHRRTLNYSWMHNPGTLEHIWSWDLNAQYHDFRFIPGFVDHFFAMDERGLAMFRLSDGTVASHLDQIPEGAREWVLSNNDGVPRLLCVNGNDLSLYSLDLTTDTPEDGENGLPVNFQMLRLYPSAMGYGLTIPVEVPRPGRLTVQILDKNNKIVATLIDEQSLQEQRMLNWESRNAPSGIYTIRAVFDGQTLTRKVLVIK
ncbi:MAG: hypothetical protein IPH75_07490 [bacterium]|nr:hypothetical protein [bacterium]